MSSQLLGLGQVVLGLQVRAAPAGHQPGQVHPDEGFGLVRGVPSQGSTGHTLHFSPALSEKEA